MPKIRRHLLISTAIVLFVGAISPSDAFFTDTPPEHKNFTAITYLNSEGVLNGFADGTFKPDQKLNRAEALKILILGSGVSIEGTPAQNPFPDVPKSEWYASYVAKGKSLGIVKGTSDGLFEPTRTINRAEALKITIAANGIELPPATKDPYIDINKDEWYAPYFAFAKTHNFFADPSYARPSTEITRGEMAEIFYRLEKWKENSHPDEGRATYYADYFDGRKTANGEIFDHTQYTAAHQTFPFDTRVLVTNLDNRKSVVVRITDRGPYAEGNIVDLTTTAFEALAPLSQGVARVKVQQMPADTPLGIPDFTACGFLAGNKTIAKDFFDKIILKEELPTIYRKNEAYIIRGTVQTNDAKITALVGEKSFEGEVKNKEFTLSIVFGESGKIDLGLLPGVSGSTKTLPVQVFAPLCDPSFAEQSGSVPRNLNIAIQKGGAVFSWEDDWNRIFKLRFTQGEKALDFYVNGGKSFTPPPAFFKDFSEGLATVEIWGAPLASAFSSSQSKNFRKGEEKNIFLTKHYAHEVDPTIRNAVLPDFYLLNSQVAISGEIAGTLRKSATLISPAGKIFDLPLELAGDKFKLTFTPNEVGTYIVEINRDDGIAAINIPLIQKGFVPLIPALREKIATTLHGEISLERDRATLLALINDARTQSGGKKLTLNENLNALAQFRANDMRDRNYFGHTDPSGKIVNDYRADHFVKTPVSENIALDINLPLAHDGLMSSPIHRRNIIDPAWENVGIGISKRSSGELIIVELFAESPYASSSLEAYREQILQKLNSARTVALVPNITLNAVAQGWADKMVKEGTPTESLGDYIRAAGITEAVNVLISKVDSLNTLIASLSQPTITLSGTPTENSFLASNWLKIGSGVAVDSLGHIAVVILVSE